MTSPDNTVAASSSEREAFEAWARGPAGYVDNQLDRYADGSYQDSTTRLHWSIFRAGWVSGNSSPQPPVAGDSVQQPVARIRHFSYRGISRNADTQEAVMLDGAPDLPEGTLLYAAPIQQAAQPEAKQDAKPVGIPAGWSVEVVGPENAIHVTAPNGRWSGVHPASAPRDALLYEFLSALLLSASPTAPAPAGAEAQQDAPAIEVTDEMALAFHRALTDGDIGSDEVEDIKTGLRAALSGVAAPAGASELPPLPEPDGFALLTPNGSKLVPPHEAKGYKSAYPFFTAVQMQEYARAALSGAPAVAAAPNADLQQAIMDLPVTLSPLQRHHLANTPPERAYNSGHYDARFAASRLVESAPAVAGAEPPHALGWIMVDKSGEPVTRRNIFPRDPSDPTMKHLLQEWDEAHSGDAPHRWARAVIEPAAHGIGSPSANAGEVDRG